MLAVRFEVPGDQGAQFTRKFTRFVDGVTDLSEPFTEIGRDLRENIIPKTLDSSGARTGTPYKDLKDKYRVRKLKRWGAKPILTASGEMRDGLTGGSASLAEVGPLRAVFGLRPGTRSYAVAGWHQSGTRRMVSRPPIAITDRDRRNWSRIIARYLQKQASE